MRRMIADPGKVLECTFENVGRTTQLHIPVNNLSELPITFDLIIPSLGLISHAFAWYSSINEEVHGGGCFLNPADFRGNIIFEAEVSSRTIPELPYLEMTMEFDNDNTQDPPITEDDRVFVTNITHLEQGIIEYKI